MNKPNRLPTLAEISDWVEKCYENVDDNNWCARVDHYDAISIAIAALHDWANHIIIDDATKLSIDELDYHNAINKWIPIEYASKEPDSTGITPNYILGFAPDEENYHISSTEGFWNISLKRWVSSLNPNFIHSPQPTHFQFLPDFPNKKSNHLNPIHNLFPPTEEK